MGDVVETDHDSIPFVEVRFAGERFDLEFLPVDVVASLQSYQELVLEVAKEIWRDNHPNKSRLPKNFSRSFKLGLGKIVPTGSKTAKLPRLRPPIEPMFAEEFYYDVFMSAQEQLASIINAANVSGNPRPVNSGVLWQLRQLRKPLRSDEVVEFNPVAEGQARSPKFRISDRTVESIAEASRFRREIQVSALGIVVGLQDHPPIVRLVSANGVIAFNLPWEELRSIDGLQMGQVVAFSIYAEVDRLDRVRRVLEHISLTPIQDEPAASRLKDRLQSLLAAYHELDEEVVDPSRETIIRAKDLSTYLGRLYHKVALYLSKEGFVQFEWTHENCAVNLSVEGKRILLGASDLGGRNFNERLYFGITASLLADLNSVRRFVAEGYE